MSFESGFSILRERAIVHTVAQAKGVAKKFTNAVVDGTPVKTGAAKGDWTATVGAPAPRIERAWDPMGINTKARVNVFIDGLSNKTDWEFYFTNTRPYAYKLEFLGLSSQAPYGMVRVQISKLAQFVKSVMGGAS